jgi:UDP-N-acetylglucosamine 2-epimerase
VIVGTRPEAIKMAPVVAALERKAPGSTLVCLTGQHRDIVADVLDLFSIQPVADLKLMVPGQHLAALTSRAIDAVHCFLASAQPDAVLVQGDTTSVMAASLAAFYCNVPVGHVEAGLRSFDYRAPFPEEMNRVVVSRLATWHFAPTETARDNLLKERVAADNVFVTGNTVIDALLDVRRRLNGANPRIVGLGSAVWPTPSTRRLILVTSHRRENFGQPLNDICQALRILSSRYPDVDFVYPVHPNGVVRSTTGRLLAGIPNVHLIEPIGYRELVALLSACTFVLTDSGGLQEEAPAFGKPVLVLRNVTERPEAIRAGSSKLVGTNTDTIVAASTELLESGTAYAAMATARNPFGDGQAAERIATVLLG